MDTTKGLILEKQIIGNLLIDCDKIRHCILRIDDFRNQQTRQIFETMSKKHSSGEKWDLCTILPDEDNKTGVSYSFLSHLCDQAHEGKQRFLEYQESLLEIRKREIVSDIIRQNGSSNPELIAEKIIRKLSKLKRSNGAKTIKNIYKLLYNWLEQQTENPNKTSGVPSLLFSLDRMTWGFQPGKLYIVAARPSMGKSALATNIATNAASEGYRVHLQSLEETARSICSRILSRYSNIPNEILSRGKINPDHWKEISKHGDRISDLNITIDESSPLSSEEICARVRNAHSQHPIDLLIVDHLQEIRERISDRRLEVSNAVSTLKALAKSLNIPVVCLCQLSRSAEYGNEKRPLLSHLKESGDIEAVADVVMLLYRDSYYNNNRSLPVNEDEMEIIVAKNRDGKTGKIILGWNPSTLTFQELNRE